MTNRMGRVLALIVLTAGVGLGTPRDVAAQGKIELTPFAGMYYTLTTMADDIFQDGSNWTARQLTAGAFGGRLAYWVSNAMGIEAAGTYSKSGVRIANSGGDSLFFGQGTLISASARLLYRPARTNLHAIIGAGIVHRGGDAWQGGEKLTKPAVTLGLGVRAAVSPKFALNLNAEGNVYSFDIDGSGSTFSSKMQADVTVTIGIPLTLGH
jgi:opacity protein-like surface antigen